MCMKAAHLGDPENLALRFYRSPHAIDDPDVDPAFKNAHYARFVMPYMVVMGVGRFRVVIWLVSELQIYAF